MSDFEVRRIERRHRAELRRMKADAEFMAMCALVIGALSAILGALLAM